MLLAELCTVKHPSSRFSAAPAFSVQAIHYPSGVSIMPGFCAPTVSFIELVQQCWNFRFICLGCGCLQINPPSIMFAFLWLAIYIESECTYIQHIYEN